PVGFGRRRPPLFAGAKLPSAQAAAPSSGPWASPGARKALLAWSPTSWAAQARRRRPQVRGEGYGFGRSCQRAPVRTIHSIPAQQGRLGSGLGPPQGDAWGSGRTGAMFSHGSAVHAELSLAISCLRVMANDTRRGQQKARYV